MPSTIDQMRVFFILSCSNPFPPLSDPVRNFEKQFPIRRKLFPEPELLNHMACHDYTPNIGRSTAISVPGPRTSTPRYSSQPHTMICRHIDEGVIGSGMGLFLIGYCVQFSMVYSSPPHVAEICAGNFCQ